MIKIPKGYVLIPIEPTDEILEAMEDGYNHDTLRKGIEVPDNDMPSAYKNLVDVCFKMNFWGIYDEK